MSKKRILVIDDDDAVRQIICQNLDDFGYDVAAAADGEEGLRALEKRLPDLVITDIIMPCKDGIEMIIELRERYPDIKVLAISGGGRMKTGDYLGLAQRLGSHDILRKPLDMTELEKAVARLTA